MLTVSFQQTRWSAEQPGASWVVRDFDTMSGNGNGGAAAKKPYAGCTACCSPSRNYPSASEALEHLHTVHLECPLGESSAGRTKDKPHDDPCYAYIKSLAPTNSIEPEIAKIAKEFLDHLSDFSGHLNKIQWLVATNSRDSVQRRRPGFNLPRPPTGAALQPQLPRSLVYAFDELVAYYILQAKRLSLENRAIGLNARDAVRESVQALERSERLARRCRDTRTRVQGYLQQARRDVILSRGGHGATGEDDLDTALGVQAFDTTSFMRAFVRSAPEVTFSAPLGQKKKAASTAARVGSGRVPAGPAQEPAWDVVGMYSEYSKQLHVEAARRPRRRLFLDIHALEDELEALEEILEINLEFIEW